MPVNSRIAQVLCTSGLQCLVKKGHGTILCVGQMGGSALGLLVLD